MEGRGGEMVGEKRKRKEREEGFFSLLRTFVFPTE
jgi:hypothetical protein